LKFYIHDFVKAAHVALRAGELRLQEGADQFERE